MPTVSVLMPAYNHELYVAEAVESVWNQSVGDLELIAIDDGSTDGTLAILKDMQARSPIPMIVETQANVGISATFNRALALARGEWISLLASDDAYEPNFIERNLAEAARFGDQPIVLHSNGLLVEPSGKVSGTLEAVSPLPPLEGDGFEALVGGNVRILTSSKFLRRSLLIHAGAFDPAMIAEDFDLHLRLSRLARFAYIPEPIFRSRHAPGSLGKKPWLWGESIISALRKHEDVLGQRMPEVLRARCLRVSSSCFDHGGWAEGLRWGKRGVNFATGAGAKSRTIGRIASNLLRAVARRSALRLVGRDRLVRAKRRITYNQASSNV